MSVYENEIEVYNFIPQKILEHGKKIVNRDERRDYYEKVLDKHINNVLILDESKYDPEIELDSALRKEIEKIRTIEDVYENDKNEHEIVIVAGKELKKFKSGELKESLQPLIEEYNLELGETVRKQRCELFERKLRDDGWAANWESISSVFREMGYVKQKYR